jgi:cob(I)alamin adenosyltransferase
MPRIYTTTGDDGTTGLLYGGRISKADLATEAYGTTDEAVAAMGLARSLCEGPALQEDILALQRDLFVVGADLATNPRQRAKLSPEVSLVTDAMVRRLETRIDDLVEEQPLPEVFILPGANPGSAALDLARSVVRQPSVAWRRWSRRAAREPRDPSVPEPAVGPAVRAGAPGKPARRTTSRDHATGTGRTPHSSGRRVADHRADRPGLDLFGNV